MDTPHKTLVATRDGAENLPHENSVPLRKAAYLRRQQQSTPASVSVQASSQRVCLAKIQLHRKRIQKNPFQNGAQDSITTDNRGASTQSKNHNMCRAKSRAKICAKNSSIKNNNNTPKKYITLQQRLKDECVINRLYQDNTNNITDLSPQGNDKSHFPKD